MIHAAPSQSSDYTLVPAAVQFLDELFFSEQHLSHVMGTEDVKPIGLHDIISLTYADPDVGSHTLIHRHIGAEEFLSDRELCKLFANNRAAHAALSYYGHASEVYTTYQNTQRYEHEQEIFMNWRNFAIDKAKAYQITFSQFTDMLVPAYHAFVEYTSRLDNATGYEKTKAVVPSEIQALDTNHNVSRVRNIILGIN